jgi:hypothetical protein
MVPSGEVILSEKSGDPGLWGKRTRVWNFSGLPLRSRLLLQFFWPYNFSWLYEQEPFWRCQLTDLGRWDGVRIRLNCASVRTGYWTLFLLVGVGRRRSVAAGSREDPAAISSNMQILLPFPSICARQSLCLGFYNREGMFIVFSHT